MFHNCDVKEKKKFSGKLAIHDPTDFTNNNLLLFIIMCVFVHNMSIILNYDKHTTRRREIFATPLHNAANSCFDTEFYVPYTRFIM